MSDSAWSQRFCPARTIADPAGRTRGFEEHSSFAEPCERAPALTLPNRSGMEDLQLSPGTVFESERVLSTARMASMAHLSCPESPRPSRHGTTIHPAARKSPSTIFLLDAFPNPSRINIWSRVEGDRLMDILEVQIRSRPEISENQCEDACCGDMFPEELPASHFPVWADR
jgi:hypothetical protein